MAPIRGKQSALQRLAEEDSKTSKDFDPEDFGNGPASDSESDESDAIDDEATSHYEAVGKSKLRKAQSADLGPQYAGSKISRHALDEAADEDEDDDDNVSLEEEIFDDGYEDEDESMMEDIDDGVDQGESDQDGIDSDDLEHHPDDDEGILDDDDHSGEDAFADTKQQSSETAALAAIAQQSQEAAVQNLAIAAQADVEKGNAVKKQRVAFNALLNTRMRLQKGLVAANTLDTLYDIEIASKTDRELIDATEKAALALFNNISSLREVMSAASTTGSRGTKRPFSATLETPTKDIHDHIQRLEKTSGPTRKAILTRWAQKTQPSAALAKTSKLREAPTQQDFVSMLDSQLTSSSLSRLVSRSRIPRSCAPVQSEKSKAEDPAIYDDADWYALLLRDLVESKMGEGGAGGSPDRGINGSLPTAASVDALRRQAKTHRANVDVKASKGRKLRYTVQEKIQNFMAPEDRTTWGERQITELFGSLLGKRVAGGLGEAESDQEDDDPMATEETAGESLRLFGR